MLQTIQSPILAFKPPKTQGTRKQRNTLSRQPGAQKERNKMIRETRKRRKEQGKNLQSPTLTFEPPTPNTSPLTHPTPQTNYSLWTPAPHSAHITKEVWNKKTKEQEDQRHKMTRGNKKKGTMYWGNKKKGTR